MQLNFSRFLTASVVAAAAFCGAVTSAHAVAVYDTITVYDSTNTVIASITVTPAEQAASPGSINYLGGVAVDPAQFGNYGIILLSGTPVDIFGIATGGPDPQDLAFSAGLVAATYAIQNPVVFTGLPIDMTQYLDPGLRAAGDTAFFTVSGGFDVAVPEPASLALLGAGMAGLGFARRRKS